MLEESTTAIAILSALRDRRDIDPRQDLAFGWIVELLWSYQLASSSDANARAHLVLDEGFCNRALTLFGYQFSENDLDGLRAYIDSIPAPDLVIVVGCDDEQAASRTTKRARFGYLSNGEAIQYTHDVARCVAATTNLLVERGIDVRTVRNDGTLADAAREMRTIVRERLTT